MYVRGVWAGRWGNEEWIFPPAAIHRSTHEKGRTRENEVLRVLISCPPWSLSFQAHCPSVTTAMPWTTAHFPAAWISWTHILDSCYPIYRDPIPGWIGDRPKFRLGTSICSLYTNSLHTNEWMIPNFLKLVN